MTELILCALMVLAFVALCWVTYRSGTKINRRPAQVLLPAFAVLFSIAAVLGFVQLDGATKSAWIAASNTLEALEEVNSIFPRALTINAAFVFMFMVFKSLYVAIAGIIPLGFLERTRFMFSFAYELDDENEWVLRRQFVGVKSLFKKMYVAVLVCATLLLMASASFPLLFGTLFYPCFAIVIFGEVVSFLSGASPKDKKDDAIEFVDDGSKRYSVYQNLMKVYERHEDRVLYSDVLHHGLFSGISRDDIIGPLESSPDRMRRLAGGYLKSLQGLHHDVDADMAMGMVGLMEGRNTLFATPFYRDYTDYLALPVVQILMHGGKVVAMYGEDVSQEDLEDWFRESLMVICGVETMWRLGSLRAHSIEELDIAFMSMSEANDLDLTRTLAKPENDVRLVAMFNPSVSFATSQIGFGILARRLAAAGNVTYCAFDRNTNGLVDALSHALSTPFCEVRPTINARGETCGIVWKAEDPEGVSLHHQLYGNVAQYLGLGTELASIALRYDVDKVTWLGSRNVPILDARWIALQYYRQICDYSNLTPASWSVDTRITFRESLWSQERSQRAFLIVEDESFNAFEALRQFSTRATTNSFVNVISPNYLLRDYMSDNSKLLVRDSKAMSRIVPDYSLGLRNVALSVFARLAQEPMDVRDVASLFELAEVDMEDLRGTLCNLALDYIVPGATRESVLECLVEETVHESIDPVSLTYIDRVQIRLVEGCELHRQCEMILRSAFYVCEDESLDKRVLGSCLYGHVYQNMVPGQFICLDGKYYEVLDIVVSSRNTSRVALRRAADHFSRRRYYRQLKRVQVGDWDTSTRWHRTRSYSGVNMDIAQVDFTVHTAGFVEMTDLADYENARYVELGCIPDRRYANKSAMKVSVDGATPEVVATLTVLLNELMSTLYADNSQYLLIGSLAAEQSDFPRGSYAQVSSLFACGEGEGKAAIGQQPAAEAEVRQQSFLDPLCIYVFEDSNIDLGLVDSFDRNIIHFLELLQDYLVWHSERMERETVIDINALAPALRGFDLDGVLASLDKSKGDGGAAAGSPDGADEAGKSKKRGLIRRILDFLARLFRRKKKGSEEPEKPAELTPEEREERNSILSDIISAIEKLMEAKRAEDAAQCEEERQLVEISDSYKESNYLFFGRGQFPRSLAVDETAMLLQDHRLVNSELSAARADAVDMREAIDEVISGETVHLCDFCGSPLLGVEYDILEDGRERCLSCSRQTVKSQAELEELFASVRGTMCATYGIHIKSAVNVRMVPTTEIAERIGTAFVATPGFDARAVGVAVNENGNYSIYLENGAPRLNLVETISHELTHIWQYENWSEADIVAKYGSGNRLVVYEGMAVWASVQYLYAVNELEYATRLFTREARREDEYGKGLRLYYSKYGMSTEKLGNRRTPFQSPRRPL